MKKDDIISMLGMAAANAQETLCVELKKRGVSGLASSHIAVLSALLTHGELPMSGIARRIGRKKNTVTTLVRRLERDGYVQRWQDEDDTRVTLISLSDKGEALRQDFQAGKRATLKRFWGDIPKQEREELLSLLARVNDNFTE